MLKKRFFQKTIMSVCLGFVCHSVFATPVFTTCPTVEMLKKFDGDLVFTAPLSFNAQSNMMQFGVFQKRKFSEFDSQEFSIYKDMNMIFMLSPIATPAGEDPEKIAMTLLDNMKADFDVPYPVRVDDTTAESFPVCSYSIPGSETKALVYVVADENFLPMMLAKQ